TINPGLSLWTLDEWLGQQFGWWSAMRQVPWSAVLVIGLTLVFLLRLREQWRPAKVAATSLVESSPTRRGHPRGLALILLALALAGAGGFAAGAWRSSGGTETAASSDSTLIDQWPARNPAPQPEPSTAGRAASVASAGWELSVYYTAVERYHSGAP